MSTRRTTIDPAGMMSGLRVLDLSHFFPGPYIGMLLQRYGATVTKIEAPGEGDLIRYVEPIVEGASIYYRALNFGKELLRLDLKSAAGLQTLRGLAAQCDVLIEAFRPGVAARLGIDYDSLREVNPRLVYCSLSAFGQFSEFKARPCHDLGVQAEASALALSNLGLDKELVPRLPMADATAALMGLSGILMALHRRASHHEGAFIDVSMYGSMLAAMPNLEAYRNKYRAASADGFERHGGEAAFYRYYATSDGRQLVLAGQEPKFVKTLLEHIGCGHLTDGYIAGAPEANRQAAEALEAHFEAMTSSEALELLERLGVCFGLVRTADEVVERELARGSGHLIEDDAGVPILGHPVQFYA